MPTPPSAKKTGYAAAKSPFFRPRDDDVTQSERRNFVRTPGGTTFRRIARPKDTTTHSNAVSDKEEHKSTILGCSSNLINAIVGAGIIGLPFAIQESGLVPGIVLTVACALVTEKSLRLLIETAKHSNVPSYETLAEAAYGKLGFWFVTISMFVMAYGAMLTYLMIVKDSFSSILGIARDDILMRRAVLITVSSLVILPLSCQRDMADLAKTSKINVVFDLIMVLIVVYLAFHNGVSVRNFEGVAGDGEFVGGGDGLPEDSIWKVQWDTIFVGVGVLSFAFVCQHSAFIIAGSLENPTQQRWSSVTRIALGFAACLALLMGISGCLGFGVPAGGRVSGNILDSLPPRSKLAKIAKGLLGTTMVFVYPMESFVARHACVVLLFEGRKAHEGDDTSVLNRRDRRITLTVALYLIAVIPAALFQDLGGVLAISGSIGGSSLSYFGPGIVYIGIHGGRFLELTEQYFGRDFLPSPITSEVGDADEESTPLVPGEPAASTGAGAAGIDCLIRRLLKTLVWYGTGMPMWTALASVGKGCLTTHVTEMALKSPHPIRIGNVRFARAKVSGGNNFTRVVMLQSPSRRKSVESATTTALHGSVRETPAETAAIDDTTDLQRFGVTTKLLRADSCPKISNDRYKLQTTSDGTIVALPAFLPPGRDTNPRTKPIQINTTPTAGYQSINQKIGAMALARAASQDTKDEGDAEFEAIAIEEDPQGKPPGPMDFAIAICYVLFGVVAMIAGLVSII